MKFKYPGLMAQFFKVWPQLRVILCELDCFSQFKFGKELVITSLVRKGDKGVHGHKRGGDARTEYAGKAYYTKKEIEAILTQFNTKYIYDPKRLQYKVIVYHKVKGSVFHLHCQVHSNTIKRCSLSNTIKVPKQREKIVKTLLEGAVKELKEWEA